MVQVLQARLLRAAHMPAVGVLVLALLWRLHLLLLLDLRPRRLLIRKTTLLQRLDRDRFHFILVKLAVADLAGLEL